MRSTRPISVTLPHEMARMVREKVASGQYATESEVIRDGLRALQKQDEAIECWLRTDVLESMAQVEADPDSVVPLEDALAVVKARFRART